MVTVSRLLNLTLFVPELDKTSFWAHPRSCALSPPTLRPLLHESFLREEKVEHGGSCSGSSVDTRRLPSAKERHRDALRASSRLVNVDMILAISRPNRAGMVLPQWTANAPTVLYATGGQARIQVVDDNGQSVFNEQVGQGQLLVVPQGFTVVKTAGETGFEWISFKTNDNAYTNTLSGETSYLRAVPLDVIKDAKATKRAAATQHSSKSSSSADAVGTRIAWPNDKLVFI